jgi:hypothetical protein
MVGESMAKPRGTPLNLNDYDPEWLIEAERAMLERGWNQANLADQVGSNAARITRMYQGDCSDETAEMVSKALKIRRPLMLHLADDLFHEWALAGQRLQQNDPARFARLVETLRETVRRQGELDQAFEKDALVPPPRVSTHPTPSKPAPSRVRPSKPRSST